MPQLDAVDFPTSRLAGVTVASSLPDRERLSDAVVPRLCGLFTPPSFLERNVPIEAVIPAEAKRRAAIRTCVVFLDLDSRCAASGMTCDWFQRIEVLTLIDQGSNFIVNARTSSKPE